jgi:O-antigen/teichoic acid export membrane protein
MDIYRLRRWILRGSISSIAPAVEFFSRFVRTIILSRLLSTEEFGIAIAITVMLGVAGLVTDVSLDKFALVESEGNDSDALAAAHLLSIVRGILIGAILAMGAPFIAASFGVPQTSWSFALAGVVPIIASAAHLGIKTVQRNYEYTPEALTILISSVVSILCLAISIYVLGDHRAILVSYLGESVAYLIASHALAPGPYRLAAHRTMIIKALVFGAPLVINGIGLALLAQFDRVLVGYWLGVDKLATYAVILNISVTPISLLLRVFGTMSLSYILSQENTGGAMSSERYYSLTFLFAVLAASYSLFVALTLDWATPLVFGQSFHVSPYAHLLITAIVFVRLQRGGAPTSVLLATGRTRELAALSLSGGAGLVIASVFLYLSPHFEMVFSGILIGELISFFLLLAVTSRTIKARGYAALIDITIGFTVLALIIGLLALFPVPNLMRVVFLLFAGGTAIALQVAIGLRLHPYLLR